MKKLIIALLCSLFIVGCSKDNEDGGNVLKGTVETYTGKTKSGKGTGATVELVDASQKVVQSTTANEDGDYGFSGVPQGTYSVFVRKEGYFNKGDNSKTNLEKAVKKYAFTGNDSTITATAYPIYKKSTAKITAVKWYSGTKDGQADGVHMDITFEGLDIPVDEKYVYFYVFAGYDQNISKSNPVEKLDRTNGGWMNGYVFCHIAKTAIKNNQLTDFRVMDFCSWRGNFGSAQVKTLPTHYAFYVSTSADGYYDYFMECGDDYSGIGETKLVVRDYGRAL